MYDWCARNWVWCYRLASGHGAWRVALNEYGQVMDPPPDEAAALQAGAPAASAAVALAR